MLYLEPLVVVAPDYAVVDRGVGPWVLVQGQGRRHEGAQGRALGQDRGVEGGGERGGVVVDVVDVDNQVAGRRPGLKWHLVNEPRHEWKT